MADTERGNFPDEKCSDCGEIGCCFKHWGPLVPEGKIGFFCPFCFSERGKLAEPISLGIKPPGIPKEFLNKDIEVTTQSGSVYRLGVVSGKTEERIVFCKQRKLNFTRARVICLVVGRSLFLKPRSCENVNLFQTSTVVSIK